MEKKVCPACGKKELIEIQLLGLFELNTELGIKEGHKMDSTSRCCGACDFRDMIEDEYAREYVIEKLTPEAIKRLEDTHDASL